MPLLQEVKKKENNDHCILLKFYTLYLMTKWLHPTQVLSRSNRKFLKYPQFTRVPCTPANVSRKRLARSLCLTPYPHIENIPEIKPMIQDICIDVHYNLIYDI